MLCKSLFVPAPPPILNLSASSLSIPTDHLLFKFKNWTTESPVPTFSIVNPTPDPVSADIWCNSYLLPIIVPLALILPEAVMWPIDSLKKSAESIDIFNTLVSSILVSISVEEKLIDISPPASEKIESNVIPPTFEIFPSLKFACPFIFKPPPIISPLALILPEAVIWAGELEVDPPCTIFKWPLIVVVPEITCR